MHERTRSRVPGDRAALGGRTPDQQLLILAILGGELPWTARSRLPGGDEALLELIEARWVVLWDRNGGESATLTPWAAERLAVEIDEPGESERPRWADLPEPADAGKPRPVRAPRDPVAGLRLPGWMAELLPAREEKAIDVLMDDDGQPIKIMGMIVYRMKSKVKPMPKAKAKRRGGAA